MRDADDGPVIVVGFDPSSTRTGYAVLRADARREDLLEFGAMTMPRWTLEQRLAKLARDTRELLAAIAGTHGTIAAAAVESPTDRRDRNASRSSLFAWVEAIGVVKGQLATHGDAAADGGLVALPVGVDHWARGKRKEERAATVAAVFPLYRREREHDRGLDEADAIGVALYACRRARERAMLEGVSMHRALRAGCGTTPTPTSSARSRGRAK